MRLRDLTGKYASGVTIGGDFQLGEVPANVAAASATANLTFSNNMNLGAASRTITVGNSGTNTLGGVISGISGTGLTIATNANGVAGADSLGGEHVRRRHDHQRGQGSIRQNDCDARLWHGVDR